MHQFVSNFCPTADLFIAPKMWLKSYMSFLKFRVNNCYLITCGGWGGG